MLLQNRKLKNSLFVKNLNTLDTKVFYKFIILYQFALYQQSIIP